MSVLDECCEYVLWMSVVDECCDDLTLYILNKQYTA